MQKRQTKQSASTRKGESTALLSSNSQPASQSSKLYRHLYAIPLENFIRCLCDNDLTALIIEGQATDDELSAVWSRLYDEYSDKMSDEDGSYLKSLVRDINMTETKVLVIGSLCRMLDYCYSFELHEELNKWTGMKQPLQPGDTEGNSKILLHIVGRASKWQMDAQNLRKEFGEMAENKSNVDGYSRDYFDGWIVALSRHNKYHVNRYETMVSEFIIMVQDLKQAAKGMDNLSKN